MKVYVASSWRCPYQHDAVCALRAMGHEVYDFRNPLPGNTGFHWSAIDPDWLQWTPERFRNALDHPIARAGFSLDIDALKWCEACLLVLPCGRSAHLELGWACGAGKRTAVWMPIPQEPELMYSMTGGVMCSLDEVAGWL